MLWWERKDESSFTSYAEVKWPKSQQLLVQQVLEIKGSFVMCPRKDSFLSTLAVLPRRPQEHPCSLPSRLQGPPLLSLVDPLWPCNSSSDTSQFPARATPTWAGQALGGDWESLCAQEAAWKGKSASSALLSHSSASQKPNKEDLNHFL